MDQCMMCAFNRRCGLKARNLDNDCRLSEPVFRDRRDPDDHDDHDDSGRVVSLQVIVLPTTLPVVVVK